MNTLFFFFFCLFLPFCWLDSIPHLHFWLFLHLHSGGGGGGAFTVALVESVADALPLVSVTEPESDRAIAEAATRRLSRAFVILPPMSGISRF